jgi:hypothetical protein
MPSVTPRGRYIELDVSSYIEENGLSDRPGDAAPAGSGSSLTPERTNTNE